MFRYKNFIVRIRRGLMPLSCPPPLSRPSTIPSPPPLPFFFSRSKKKEDKKETTSSGLKMFRGPSARQRAPLALTQWPIYAEMEDVGCAWSKRQAHIGFSLFPLASNADQNYMTIEIEQYCIGEMLFIFIVIDLQLKDDTRWQETRANSQQRRLLHWQSCSLK